MGNLPGGGMHTEHTPTDGGDTGDNPASDKSVRTSYCDANSSVRNSCVEGRCSGDGPVVGPDAPPDASCPGAIPQRPTPPDPHTLLNTALPPINPHQDLYSELPCPTLRGLHPQTLNPEP